MLLKLGSWVWVRKMDLPWRRREINGDKYVEFIVRMIEWYG